MTSTRNRSKQPSFGGARLACALATGLALIMVAGAAATASPRDVTGARVVAESQFGNGTVSGLVRSDPDGGLEVQLPSGTWIACRRQCSETLRVETVDFWQAQAKTTNECGLLGCLQLHYPRR